MNFCILEGVIPGVEWVQEQGRWRVLYENETQRAQAKKFAEDHAGALDLMNKAMKAQEAGDNGDASDYYEDVIDEYPDTPFAPEALYQRGILYTKSHQFEDAIQLFNQVVQEYPEYPKFNNVIERQFIIGEMIQDGAHPYYWGVIPGFMNKQTAISAYEHVVTNAPFTKFAPLALLNIAIVANDDGKEEEAIDALDRLINTYPNSIVTDDAYLTLAQTYASIVQGPEYDQEATMQAIGYYQDYLLLFPKANARETAKEELAKMRGILAESKYELGEFYYRYRNNNRAAVTFYNETITTYPDSKIADKAHYMIAQIKDGVKAPLTPADWVFGRYQEPSLKGYLEQSEVDNLEDENFQIQSTEAFLETPGTAAVEEFSPGMPPQEYEGIGVPLDPFFYDAPYYMEPIGPWYDGDPFLDPWGPTYLDILEPYEAPGPTTEQQQKINEEKQKQAENSSIPAGGS